MDNDNPALAEIWDIMPFLGGVSLNGLGWERFGNESLLPAYLGTVLVITLCLHSQTTAMLAPGRTLNFSSMLPANRSYVTYSGSLTTPPCTEGVMWHVMTTPQSISLHQVRPTGGHGVIDDDARECGQYGG